MPVRYRTVPNFSVYRVGDDGSVWSCLVRRGLGTGRGSTFVISREWHRLRPRKDKDGYLSVKLCQNGRKWRVRVNRLVLIAFEGPRGDEYEAAHINGKRDDNRRGNLAWKTSVENQEDRRRHGTLPMGEEHANAKLTSETAMLCVLPENLHLSHAALGRQLGVTSQAVAAVRKGKTWKHVTRLTAPLPARPVGRPRISR